jgi:dynein intermediate chain, cytosolic
VTSPAGSGERRAQVDELVSTLIGSRREAAETNPNWRTTQCSPAFSPSRELLQNGARTSRQPDTESASTQTLSTAPTSTVFEIAPNTAPHREYITYSKGVQTESTSVGDLEEHEELEVELDPVGKKRQNQDEERRSEEIRASLRKEIEDELRAIADSTSTNMPPAAQQRYPLRTLTSDEMNSVTASNDFLSFVERSSKVIERALDDDYDLLADYTVSNTHEDDLSDEESFFYSRPSRKSHALKQTQQFFDSSQSRRREISDLQFSPHFGELLLSSHTKNSAAANDSSSLIMLWNVHAPSRPEYTFRSQGADIVSARFSPFHPSFVIGGCYTGQVCLWDTRATSRSSGAPVLKTPQSGSHLGHNHPIYSISIIGTPHAHNILTASTDGVVCSWSFDMLTQPQEYLELSTPPPAKTEDLAPTCMTFPASDPTFFLVGTEEGSIYPCHRYDRAGAKAGVDTKLAYKGHTAPVMSSQFHPAKGPVDLGNLLLTCSIDWSVKLWRIRPAATSSTVAASGGTTSVTIGGTGGAQSIGPVLDISREDLVYDAKWAPHKPSVFACVAGNGDLEVFDLNVDLEVPVAKASPTRGQTGALVGGLNKCAWEEKRGGLIATGGLDGTVSLFEVGKALSGEARTDEWAAMKKAVTRAEGWKS